MFRRTNHASGATCRQLFFRVLICLRCSQPEDRLRATERDATQTPEDPTDGADRENSSNKTSLCLRAASSTS